MVTHQKEVCYGLRIWHLDLTHKTRTRWQLPGDGVWHWRLSLVKVIFMSNPTQGYVRLKLSWVVVGVLTIKANNFFCMGERWASHIFYVYYSSYLKKIIVLTIIMLNDFDWWWKSPQHLHPSSLTLLWFGWDIIFTLIFYIYSFFKCRVFKNFMRHNLIQIDMVWIFVMKSRDTWGGRSPDSWLVHDHQSFLKEKVLT